MVNFPYDLPVELGMVVVGLVRGVSGCVFDSILMRWVCFVCIIWVNLDPCFLPSVLWFRIGVKSMAGHKQSGSTHQVS